MNGGLDYEDELISDVEGMAMWRGINTNLLVYAWLVVGGGEGYQLHYEQDGYKDGDGGRVVAHKTYRLIGSVGWWRYKDGGWVNTNWLVD